MIKINNQLQIFNNEQFGEVRWTNIDNKDYAVAKDIAKALGYKNTNDAIIRHCKRVVKHDGFKINGIEVALIPEGDIYRLTAKSELPGADKFESWIFDEVLPSIRKTGSYNTTGITKEDVFEVIRNLPKDKYKNKAVAELMRLIPIEPKQLQASSLTKEEVQLILDEFLAKYDVIIRRVEQGLAVKKEKLYKEFKKYNLSNTGILKILDNYGFIYHRDDSRTPIVKFENTPTRAIILKI